MRGRKTRSAVLLTRIVEEYLRWRTLQPLIPTHFSVMQENTANGERVHKETQRIGERGSAGDRERERGTKREGKSEHGRWRGR